MTEIQEAELTREERFAGLVERQSRFVFRVAYAVVRHAEDAEDVVQETFLKLYRGSAWEGLADERAFLARAAWRMAVDKVRGRRKFVAGAAEGSANLAEAMEAADWNAAVHRLVDGLPQELRQPLALSAVDEMTSREIARTMGIAEGTVRTRIMRARQMLREKLKVLMEGRDGKR